MSNALDKQKQERNLIFRDRELLTEYKLSSEDREKFIRLFKIGVCRELNRKKLIDDECLDMIISRLGSK